MEIQYGDLYSKIGILRQTIEKYETLQKAQGYDIKGIRELFNSQSSFKNYDIINLDFLICQKQDELDALKKVIESLQIEIDPIIRDKLNRIYSQYRF